MLSLTPIKSDKADRLNLLGFTGHESSNLKGVGSLNLKALMIDPKHAKALEYQEEVFLQL